MALPRDQRPAQALLLGRQLLGAAIGAAAVVDLALILAVLAAFAALAFVKAGVRPGGDPAEPEDRA